MNSSAGVPRPLKAEALPSGAPASKGLKRPAILVVDSDVSVQERMKKSLERGGYEVRQAFAGNKAIDIFLERKPDAILMDIDFSKRVSEINGIDLIRYIKRLRHDPVPVILYAAESERVLAAMEAGATRFVPRTASPEEVVRSLARVLGEDRPPPVS